VAGVRSNIIGAATKSIVIVDPSTNNQIDVGYIREGSLKTSASRSTETLQDGSEQQLDVEIPFEADILETDQAKITALDGLVGANVTILVTSIAETLKFTNTSYMIWLDAPTSAKKANALKIRWMVRASKISAAFTKFPGLIYPNETILKIDAPTQQVVGTTTIQDESNAQRTIDANGMTGAQLWDADARSLKFDGVNDYLSVPDSRFRGGEMIGLGDANNRTLDATIGNWAKQNTNDTFASVSGGSTGNGGKLTIGASAAVSLLKLLSDVTALAVGSSYHFQADVKFQTSWNGGYIEVLIGGNSNRFYLTGSFVTVAFDFVAATTDSSINISCGTAPTAGDIFWLDNLSLTSSSQLNLHNGERILSANDKDFDQATIGNWTVHGNHTANTLNYNPPDYVMRVISSGTGNQTTNYVSLPASAFAPLVAGKAYTLEMRCIGGSGGIVKFAGFGASGQNASLGGTSTGTLDKDVWTFIAGAGDVGQDLRIWLNGSYPFGLWISSISITEAVDFTALVWFKKTTDTAVDSHLFVIGGAAAHYRLTILENTTNDLSLVAYDGVISESIHASSNIIDGAWHLGVIVISAVNGITIFQDNAQMANAATTFGRIQMGSAGKLSIAASWVPGNFYLGNIGIIELLRGKALVLADVQDYYAKTKGAMGL
jgi:hypothetical protein